MNTLERLLTTKGPTVQQYLKAIAASISTGLGALAAILVGTHTTFAQITDAQWVTVAIGVLGALGAVWAIPNAPAPAKTAAKPIV